MQYKNPSRPSVNDHSFREVPDVDVPRSRFDRSHAVKTTLNSGFLVPIYVDEALPGDTFTMKLTTFARLATPLHPVMDNMYLDVFFFSVPIRLIWDNWERFNGAQDNPDDATDYSVPTLTGVQTADADGDPGTGPGREQLLSDYLGFPNGVKMDNLQPVSLWHRAYNLIWNEWFRDQNLQDSVSVPTGDGPDSHSVFELLRRGKRHDYFTSCLPFPQKGDDVTLSLGDTAPVSGSIESTGNAFTLEDVGGNTAPYTFTQNSNNHWVNPSAQGYSTIEKEYQSGLQLANMEADLTNATAQTINDIRRAFQIQKLLEKDARGGTRYVEVIRSHFGVTSPDFRLQRPEYLGGGSTPLMVNPVPQTAQDDNSPQGNLAGVGTASHDAVGFNHSFTEHCVVLGLISARADLTYQQGLERMFSRSTRYDFYWPSLAHLGEQAVLNKEIYADGSAQDDEVFGYQERFAEYRYKPSKITGKFRSSSSQSLDIWHLSQDFANLPSLNSEFIEDEPPVDRVVAVPSEPDFLLDCWFDFKCARPMPTYGVPGFVDHF